MHLISLAEDLLTLLQGRELYGLAIADAFRRIAGRTFVPRPGSLYPMLHKLEAEGLVRSWWEGSARYYTTTLAGDALLQTTRMRRRQLAQYAKGRRDGEVLQQVRQVL